jgi:hypothetical protein
MQKILHRNLRGLLDRLRHACASLELVRQTIHVVHVIVFALGVLSLRCVAAAACKVTRRMVGAGQGAVADAIAIQVL